MKGTNLTRLDKIVCIIGTRCAGYFKLQQSKQIQLPAELRNHMHMECLPCKLSKDTKLNFKAVWSNGTNWVSSPCDSSSSSSSRSRYTRPKHPSQTATKASLHECYCHHNCHLTNLEPAKIQALSPVAMYV